MPLQSLKEDLLEALQDIAPDGFNGVALPPNASEIPLAKPIDPTDLSQGWEPLEQSYALEDPFNIDESAPKGKAKKLESENLRAYGIKENAVLAFRFWTQRDKGWDVVPVVHMDEYGIENEGDMGVPKQYRG
jgi:hypothetical protein